MSDTTNDPQLADPPTNTGGGGTPSDAEEIQTEEAMADPPTNTGGGSSA
ncbi:MAG TPA: hypothetical protein VKB02_03395 [Pyrinomonadaceae bacterium]|nr:hypothetical protein [Pyrinomonadaceae bacterium]